MVVVRKRVEKELPRIFAKQNTIYNMGVWNQIAEYLYLKKKDPNAKPTTWMKYMHGINRLSILLFLFAILVIVFRLFFGK
jgi:hypothetical protein